MWLIQVGHLAYGENSKFIIIGLNIILISALIYYLIKKSSTFSIINFAISMIIGGGISNLIDRIFRGSVIDYIDINYWIKYPVFNIADIFIVIGVIIVIGYLIIRVIKEQEKA